MFICHTGDVSEASEGEESKDHLISQKTTAVEAPSKNLLLSYRIFSMETINDVRAKVTSSRYANNLK